MCKSKMSTKIITKETPQPTRSSSTSINNPSFTPRSSSNKTATATATTTITTAATSSSIGSSKKSLSTIRSSLPENPHLYDISEIRHATNNFLSKNNLTSSTTRSWNCQLHGKHVAIFQRKSQTQLNEVNIRRKLSTVCRSHHIAIVNLLGACISGEYIYLVYDYIRGASLHDLLHSNNNNYYTVLNTWMSRVRLGSDLANGLDYIHNNSSTGLDVHNHVNSSSVIVSENDNGFNAKLAHFGVAELCGEVVEEKNGGKSEVVDVEEVGGGGTTSSRRLSRSNSVKFNGTRGYMSPEFQATGVGTRKSDVYPFGVVLIELLSGEEPVKYKLDKTTREYRKFSIVDAALGVMEDDPDGEGGERGGKIRKWIDQRLRNSYPVDVAEKLTRLAVECVNLDPDKRPDMRRVAGKISKLYLESQAWSEKMSVPTDFTVICSAVDDCCRVVFVLTS